MAAPGDKLLRDQLVVTVALFIVGVLQLIFTTAALTTWAWYAERVAGRLRQMVYDAVTAKGLDWFDTGMGRAQGGEDEESGDGLGGLTARFTRSVGKR